MYDIVRYDLNAQLSRDFEFSTFDWCEMVD